MTQNLKILSVFILGIIFGVIYAGTIHAHTEPKVETVTEYVYIESEPEVYYPNLTSYECDLLEQIAYAEARGEGVKGMILVMNVVLNRVHADGFGDSVEEVIFADGQFYTAGMTPNVSDECHEAMALVLEGADFSQGALFFNKYGYRANKEPLFQYGNHYFSK